MFIKNTNLNFEPAHYKEFDEISCLSEKC
jgi:hypothetical protein